MKVKIGIAILAMLSITIACKHKQQNNQTQFALHNPSSSVSGISGLIDMKRIGIPTNFDKIKVCFGEGKGQFTKEHLALETKLALVMWLNASGRYGVEDWQRFEFVFDNKCEENGKNYQIAVYVNKNSLLDQKIESDEYIKNLGTINNGELHFLQGKARCYIKVFEAISGCEGANRIVLGLAGVAEFNYNHPTENKKHFTKINVADASRLRLSPFIDLIPLTVDFSLRKDIEKEKRNQFIEIYNQLLEQENASYMDLLQLGEMLQELRLNAYEYSKKLEKVRDEKLGYSSDFQVKLREQLKRLANLGTKSTRLSKTKKDAINENYRQYFEVKKFLELPDVKRFIEYVERALGIESDSPEFDSIIKEIGVLGSMNTEFVFEREQTAFRIILHEVGHQFGITHAHEKKSSTVTGTILIKKNKNESGQIVETKEYVIKSLPGEKEQFVTDNSTMSYKYFPLYLSQEDDVPAIQLMTEAVYRVLKRRSVGDPDPTAKDEWNAIIKKQKPNEESDPNIIFKTEIE